MAEEAVFKIVLEAGASLAQAYASRPAPAAPAQPVGAAPTIAAPVRAAPITAAATAPITARPAPTVAPGAAPQMFTARPAPQPPAPGNAPPPVGAAPTRQPAAQPITAAPIAQQALGAQPITAAPAAPLATAKPVTPAAPISAAPTPAFDPVAIARERLRREKEAEAINAAYEQLKPFDPVRAARERIEREKRADDLRAAYDRETFGAKKSFSMAGAAAAGHAQMIGRALGGSEGGIGVAGADVGLELAQQIAPMFGPAGAVVGGAAKAVAVGLQMVEAASKQAAKNIGAFGSMQASLGSGDLLGAQRKYYEKQDEERGATATIKDALFFGAMAEPFKKWFSALPINGPAKSAAAIGAFQETAGAYTARANQLAPFSAALSMATAQARIQQIQTAAKLAQGPLGQSAAKFVAAQGDYKTAVDTTLADRQAKKFDELRDAYERGQIGQKEYVQKLEELNKKENLGELLAGDTKESKELLAKILKNMEKARKDRKEGGGFNMKKLIDDFLKRGDMLPQMPPDNPFQPAPMQPLQI